MALANCIKTLKDSKNISPWLADDIDQAIANRGRTSKKNAIAAYIDSALADMKAELEDVYDDVGIDAKDPLLGYVAPAAEEVGDDNAAFSTFRSVDTESDEFKKWFGNSKVVDADGKPLVAYHGTAADFSAFKHSRSDVGMHFGTVAQADDRLAYQRDRGAKTEEGMNLMPVYLAIRNPLRLPDLGAWNTDTMGYALRDLFPNDKARINSLKTPKQIREYLKGKGYDGIVYKNTGEVGGSQPYRDAINIAKEAKDKVFPKGKSSFSVEDQKVPEYMAWSAAEKAYRDYLKANGEDSYIAFSPTQIKSATSNTGEFSDTNPDIRFSTRRNWYYSQLEESIDAIPKKITTGNEIALWLASNAGKLQIKKDELEWSGVLDYLRMRGKDKVSSAEVKEFLASNNVQVKDVMLGDVDVVTDEEIEDGAVIGKYSVVFDDGLGAKYKIYEDDRLVKEFSSKGGAADWLNDMTESNPRTLFNQYVLPGGENYKELLITLPEVKDNAAELRAEYQPAVDAALEKGDITEAVRLQKERDDKIYARRQKAEKAFRSSHFDQPNILAHLRFNERTDAEGRRVLFIEEIQSDWGQKGKKEGFREEAKLGESFKRDDGFWGVKDGNGNEQPIWFESKAEAENWMATKFGSRRSTSTAVPSAPFVTDTKSWTSLALKRAIAYAVDNGFDRIAWTTGEQQAERYSLAQHISRIQYVTNEDGSYDFIAFDKQKREAINETSIDIYRIEDLVGKEMADKISKGRATSYRETDDRYWSVISGLDLKVGGEGMKGFYDQIVPQVAKKLGAEVGLGVIGQQDATKDFFDFFGGRELAGKPLDAVMYDGVVATRNHDQVIKAVVKAIPVDVVNMLASNGISAKNLASNPKMHLNHLPSDLRVTVANGILGAFSEVSARIRAGLRSAYEAGLDKEILPALKASDLSLNEAVRVLGLSKFDKSISGSDLGGSRSGSLGAGAGAESSGLSSGLGGGKLSPAEVAKFVSWHGSISSHGVSDGSILLQPSFPITPAMRDQVQSKGMPLFSEKRLADDLAEQEVFLTDKAKQAGYKNIDDFAGQDITRFLKAAEEWRDRNPAEVLESTYRAVDTSSPEFKKWFGDSRVVDADGKPLVVYHGTYSDFSKPKTNWGDDEWRRFGIHLGSLDAAQSRLGIKAAEDAANNERSGNADQNVMPVYASIKQPLRLKENRTGRWGVNDILQQIIEEAEAGNPDLDWVSPDFIDAFYSDMTELEDGSDKFWQNDSDWESGEKTDALVKWLGEAGFDGIVYNNEFEGGGDSYIVFSPTQIKSAISNTGEFSDINPDIRETTARSQLTGQQIQNTWASPALDKWDDFKRKIQDKMVDTKAVVDAIKAAGRQIKDQFDPYLQEILYHGRAAKQVDDFTTNELKPLFEEMAKYKVEVNELGTYLWAMHAPERNAQIAKINPAMANGSGMTDQQARDILAGHTVTINGKDYKLERNKMMAYRALGAKVKAINKGTTDLLVASGLETQDTVDAWENAYRNYVPLMRDMEADDNFMGAFNLGMGTGQGFSVKGSASKRAMGSEREVIDILANVAMQRERAITRAEKNRVAMAVYGMALQNPNTDFWLTINPDAKDPAKIAQVIQELIAMGVNPIDAQNIASEPKQTYVDPNTGMVAHRINPQLRTRSDVLAVRINGKDRYVMFSSDARAQQMVTGLKNLDAEQLGVVMQKVAVATRYFASINTQYNPIFGLTNILRDSSTAMLNLTSTPLAGKQADVSKHVMSALSGIYRDLRDHRAGKQPTSAWAQEFEEFQRYGGQTGYRDMFQTSKDRADAISREIRKAGKGEAAWKIFSPDHPIGGWLSDYNTSLENAWRLAAYKVAKENGMSHQQAAALAKNLTVNFNKKGQAATQMGAMYAFFNAAVQGTARIAQTMIKDGKLTPAGKKIMLGGMTVGVMQAVMFALAGWDDEEPPQFIREKNFIIPLPNGKYVSIPYPLGFHVIPGFGRIATEFVLGGFRDPAKRLVQMTNMIIDGFNPLGSSTPLQTLTPTVVDPITALAENKDWSGKNIYKEDFNKMKPTAGWTRTKDTATDLSKALSYGLNYISGGGKYGIGEFSPTPDQLDYIGGQIAGGLGREVSKGWQAGKSMTSGEELPAYKRPVLGRFYGETTGQASEMSKFYGNLKRIGEHHSALEEMKDAKDFDARREYLKEYPEARLVSLADKAQRELGYLKRQKRDAMEKGEAGRVKMLEARITQTVQRWNEKLSPKEE